MAYPRVVEPIGVVTATLTVQGTYSDPLAMHRGNFNFVVSGISGDTVCLQRSNDGGLTWADCATYTEDGWYAGTEPEHGIKWRFGLKVASQGTIVGRLSF